jgi:predicted nucleic acid-binding Zn ribbon protein
MTFQSLNHILTTIAKQPNWEKQRQYHHLIQCWQKVVNDKVAQHTRPLYLQRQILWIATSSSVWAQNLALQRYPLLKKLNQLLDEPILDLRFSPARWAQKHQSDSEGMPSLSQHPSALNLDSELLSPPAREPATTPQEAFQRWAEVIKKRSLHLPPCPCCQCPTPEGELKRWQMCACCAAKKFSQSVNFHSIKE